EGWTVAEPTVSPDSLDWRLAVTIDDKFGYRVRDASANETATGDLELAIGLIRLQMRRFAGLHAHDLTFVHAGVVPHQKAAVMIPGHSFSGKSTLVEALVRRGAVYYSDEYAVIDEQGLVHPYREPLSLRDASNEVRTRLTAESLGSTSGEKPVR